MGGFFRFAREAYSTEVAEARLRDLYGDVRLGGLGGYEEAAVGEDRFTIVDVRLSGDFQVQADVDTITVAYSTPGYEWRVGREEGRLDREPAVFQPREPMASRIGGATLVTTVNFDPGALSELATAIYGMSMRPWFTAQRPASAASGRHWMRLVPLMRDAAVLENDLSRATAYHALALAALEGFRLSGDASERRHGARTGLAAYGRACRFIDEHLSLPITIADIAAAAGVTEGELALAFRGHSPQSWSPAEHLRRARLAAAHLDIVNGDPTRGDTVQAIAARWGFPHPGRFAELYRDVYRTNPRYVLER
ncbi:helix-turn-helix domain-containing protein [Leifsonia poae]|uniref:helix-turn-helix domain-containing protein n=1 Tax=Leifsonia poae TaxID=110933 RepID=UPI003D69635C